MVWMSTFPICDMNNTKTIPEFPPLSFGTPLEDAYRRDFTMHSLFYNLQTNQIEDWTRHGIPDLRQGLVATKLQAYQTFHDDPLRVLRAIQFAVIYDMHMDHDLQTACKHPQIHNELHRERVVGKELEGMSSGKGARPKVALETIHFLQLKLAGNVFCLPSECHGSIGLAHPQPYQGTVEHLSQLRDILLPTDFGSFETPTGWNSRRCSHDLCGGLCPSPFQARLTTQKQGQTRRRIHVTRRHQVQKQGYQTHDDSYGTGRRNGAPTTYEFGGYEQEQNTIEAGSWIDTSSK